VVANALVQTRIDADLKARATAVLDNIGLTVSDVMRIVLTRVAKEGALPAGLTVDAAAMTPGSEPRCRRPWMIRALPSPTRKLKRISPSAEQLHGSKRVSDA
jgi:addiction module RelB/DinJ family antitoxin